MITMNLNKDINDCIACIYTYIFSIIIKVKFIELKIYIYRRFK